MYYISNIAIPEQTFWVVCGLFYLADNIKRLDVRYLILLQSVSGRWSTVLPLYRYRIAGKAVTILNPLLPWCAGVQMRWLTADPFDRVAERRTRRLLFVSTNRLRDFSVLSAMLFVMFFVIGPLTTHFRSLSFALHLVLPVHFISVILLIILLVSQKHIWRMNSSKLVWLVLECAICPGYFINICRKISLEYIHVPADAIGYAFSSSEAARAKVERSLEPYLEELCESSEIGVSEQPTIALYRSRLKEPVGTKAI